MDRKQIITACTGILLASIAAAGIAGWISEHKKVEDLQAQVGEMQKQVMRSAVDRSISAQMEDIAKEQREISDEKREEALQQTRAAEEMGRLLEMLYKRECVSPAADAEMLEILKNQRLNGKMPLKRSVMPWLQRKRLWRLHRLLRISANWLRISASWPNTNRKWLSTSAFRRSSPSERPIR